LNERGGSRIGGGPRGGVDSPTFHTEFAITLARRLAHRAVLRSGSRRSRCRRGRGGGGRCRFRRGCSSRCGRCRLGRGGGSRCGRGLRSSRWRGHSHATIADGWLGPSLWGSGRCRSLIIRSCLRVHALQTGQHCLQARRGVRVGCHNGLSPQVRLPQGCETSCPTGQNFHATGQSLLPALPETGDAKWGCESPRPLPSRSWFAIRYRSWCPQ
jgi:hypothetical protein